MLHAPVNETKSENGQAKRPLTPLLERERYPVSVETPGQQSPVGNGSGLTRQSGAAQYRSHVGNLQRMYGNQAVLQMHSGPGGQLLPLTLLRPSQSGLLLQRKCACGGTAGMSGECAECQQKQEDILQRRAANQAEPGTVPPIVHEVLRSLGQPLDPATRAFMEPRFGYDFSEVRVHTDAKSAEVAAAIRRQDEPATQPEPAAALGQTPAPPTGPTQGQETQPADTPAQTGGGPKLYGLLSRSIRGPLTFAPWAFGAQQEPGVGIYSPLMSATGTVIADASVPVAEYEIGFVQALIVSNMTATYTDRNGRAVQYLQIGVSQQPIRDGLAGSKPWLKQQDVKSLDAKDGYIVNTEDRPRNMAPWQTPDQRGSLSSAEGTEFFCTWLAARHKPSRRMYYLGWGSWTVDWGSAFDAASQTGKSTGAGGKEVWDGDKQGLFTPLEGDPVANDSITVRWSATP